MSSGIKELDARGNARRNAGNAGFSICIAKISQGLRKFRKDSENFATIGKISESLRNFAMHIFSL